MKTLQIKSGSTFLQIFIQNAPAGFNGSWVLRSGDKIKEGVSFGNITLNDGSSTEVVFEASTGPRYDIIADEMQNDFSAELDEVMATATGDRVLIKIQDDDDTDTVVLERVTVTGATKFLRYADKDYVQTEAGASADTTYTLDSVTITPDVDAKTFTAVKEYTVLKDSVISGNGGGVYNLIVYAKYGQVGSFIGRSPKGRNTH